MGRLPAGSQARPWGSSRREGRGFVPAPSCSALLFLGVRLSRELGVLKKINFLILQ